eukprot:CAMPEP_0185851504 /NCGR_PEP_ID=MMETSP1354-20130828/10109_1 /TAXON_ID=708628 /ORGANISM="Erythrolobus madagascarensis, Strain CCMP3276" /LENGTH=589 /DNA_ID=CAMNT_0028552505 /DNA_START=112 /DNA_END=1881 /DNA_ORIENTATION=+
MKTASQGLDGFEYNEGERPVVMESARADAARDSGSRMLWDRLSEAVPYDLGATFERLDHCNLPNEYAVHSGHATMLRVKRKRHDNPLDKLQLRYQSVKRPVQSKQFSGLSLKDGSGHQQQQPLEQSQPLRASPAPSFVEGCDEEECGKVLLYEKSGCDRTDGRHEAFPGDSCSYAPNEPEHLRRPLVNGPRRSVLLDCDFMRVGTLSFKSTTESQATEWKGPLDPEPVRSRATLSSGSSVCPVKVHAEDYSARCETNLWPGAAAENTVCEEVPGCGVDGGVPVHKRRNYRSFDVRERQDRRAFAQLTELRSSRSGPHGNESCRSTTEMGDTVSSLTTVSMEKRKSFHDGANSSVRFIDVVPRAHDGSVLEWQTGLTSGDLLLSQQPCEAQEEEACALDHEGLKRRAAMGSPRCQQQQDQINTGALLSVERGVTPLAFSQTHVLSTDRAALPRMEQRSLDTSNSDSWEPESTRHMSDSTYEAGLESGGLESDAATVVKESARLAESTAAALEKKNMKSERKPRGASDEDYVYDVYTAVDRNWSLADSKRTEFTTGFVFAPHPVQSQRLSGVMSMDPDEYLDGYEVDDEAE